MSVSYEQRCEVAAKVRDVMGELATIRLDGVPLADLIAPSGGDEWVEDNGGLESVKSRLVPEGMEWLLEVWPKWSNGEYCKFGDWWKSDKYGESEPKQFRKLSIYTPDQLREWGQDDGESYGYEWDFVRPSEPKYRPDKAEPPAPKARDADGAPIKVGDTVYDTKLANGDKFTVESIDKNGDVKARGDKYIVTQSSVAFTHRAPVLAADGRPLREGETVYDIDDAKGYPHTVASIELYGLGHVKTTCGKPLPASVSIHPSRLTHERPDSWGQLDKDACKDRCTYFGSTYRDCENCSQVAAECYIQKCRDLVRRAKKLAGVGE